MKLDNSKRATVKPATASPADGLHSVIGYQIAQASITAMEVFTSTVGRPMDLRPVEYTILTLVQQNPGISPARLAEALAVTKPNITMWIDKLESRGLVGRLRSETDKRAQHLQTTPKGAQLSAKATTALVAAEGAAFASLTEGERAILVELLVKLAKCRTGRNDSSS